MYLRELKQEDDRSYKDYITKWQQSKEHIVPSITNIDKYDSFASLVKYLKETQISNHSWVPSTTLFCFDEHTNRILGAINIRHHLNEQLQQIGGHIGYGVSPGYRELGIAKFMVTVALEILTEMNMTQVLITCDDNNIASQKVINHFNAKEIIPYLKQDGKKVRRYIIDLA
ncbi:GNAT family N-acetyltransferase [Staphylococcus simiae]|uniref:GNAT family N-acetyltransferase n=1 Tax=Staphylococcus simiae TaxID=308354 RepID=UPI001A95C89C|nr:GNAT family N-acetyltransferase [Staphylococcus simiae]MBO1199229.1 GNAT family N-acetyltransferase [Staphylococcus simiae]MBO1201429.1 GNAT family N-acetyltransferase [Staphylococcus simiae]MBO1203602.1 GNAT family N-acetyltransferase [Staphylococcus simiae]MBO1211200.1 GNAT family N-acetyltransferase [Staphylococcus simiae]MBO1229836.1 GNAT family N-acetyltransferase [Staphylococcus simiae]